jgi:hypothetical protein
MGMRHYGRVALLFAVMTLLSACAEHTATGPYQDTQGHGRVEYSSRICVDDEGIDQGGSIDWGDGTTTMYARYINHNYAYNGTYTITIRCGSWPYFFPFGSKHVTQANINTAVEAPPSAFSAGMISAVAALIASIVGALSFVAGRRQGQKARTEDE